MQFLLFLKLTVRAQPITATSLAAESRTVCPLHLSEALAVLSSLGPADNAQETGFPFPDAAPAVPQAPCC